VYALLLDGEIVEVREPASTGKFKLSDGRLMRPPASGWTDGLAAARALDAGGSPGPLESVPRHLQGVLAHPFTPSARRHVVAFSARGVKSPERATPTRQPRPVFGLRGLTGRVFAEKGAAPSLPTQRTGAAPVRKAAVGLPCAGCADTRNRPLSQVCGPGERAEREG
jgi:hypothetical protein